ncbi:MAG: FlgD immunoglobulin-like domain containing protein, partial [bacterium]
YEADYQTAINEETPRIRTTAITSLHPNPFNPNLNIEFTLERRGEVELSIYDIRGRLVRRLIQDERPAGPHVAQWDGKSDNGNQVASGIYFVRLEAMGRVDHRKAVMIK